MIRFLLLFFNSVLLVLFGLMPGEEVTLNMSAPDSVIAGTDFEVQITLNKSNLESFSRLLQEIPAGLTAISKTSANSNFDFKNKKITMIWLKLPTENQVTVSYTVSIDTRLKGTFNLGGKFSYIENNERKSVEIPEKTITIKPSPTIDPSFTVDIKDYERLVIPSFVPSADQADIVCIRQRPSNPVGASNGYVINILVNKTDKLDFAKIEERIPDGFKAVTMDSKNGIFTYKDKFAKILWMSLPAESHFVVSYMVVPENVSNTSKPDLNGKFSYLTDDRTYTVDIVEKDMNVAELEGDALKQVIADASSVSKPYESNDIFADNKKNTDVKNTDKTITVNKNTKNNNDLAQINNNKTGIYGKSPKHKDSFQAYLLEPEEGVYYRVQIAAGHKPVDIIRYFKKYKVDGEIRTESHEGWYKYSVGSYSEYLKARDYRNTIWNMSISDAFVSAYNSGKRITVQEALMVSNQKWYK